MLSFLKNDDKKVNTATPKTVAVINNNLDEEEMNDAGKQWLSHHGSYMNLAEALAFADKNRLSEDSDQTLNDQY